MTDIAPGLTPLRIESFPFAALSGMSFEHLHFSVWRAGKRSLIIPGMSCLPTWVYQARVFLMLPGTYGPVTRSGSRLQGTSGAGSLRLTWRNVSKKTGPGSFPRSLPRTRFPNASTGNCLPCPVFLLISDVHTSPRHSDQNSLQTLRNSPSPLQHPGIFRLPW